MHNQPYAPLITRLRPHHWLLFDTVAATVYGLCAWSLFAHKISSPPLAILGPVSVTAAIGLARRQPLPALVAALLGFWLSPLSVTLAFVALVPACWALYCGATRFARHVNFAVLVLALTGAAATGLGGHGRGGVAVFALAMLSTWTLGYVIGQTRRYSDDLLRHREQLADAELDLARRGILDERMRIARELHDVLAHSISVMTVQAAYGHLVLDAEPDRARTSLAAIETAGRDTLIEIRRLLDVLRDDTTNPASPRAPSPGMADLQRLAGHIAQAGVRVQLSIVGNARPLPSGLDLTAYRIVQEALTNVVKHANTSAATVAIDFGADQLVIDVTDRGVGPQSASESGPGHGILGMRERAGLYGGTLTTSATPAGGFRVLAQLPIRIDAGNRPLDANACA